MRMRNTREVVIGVLLVTFAVVLTMKSAMAQDPVKGAPDQYKVLLENDRVRALESRLKPGQKEPMHSHPACIVYYFGDAKFKTTFPDGRTTESVVTPGETIWRNPVTHAAEIVGTTESRVLIFELKGGKSGKTAKGADPVKADPKHFKVRLNNARVRVLEFTAKPGDKVPMHSHPDYVTYNFTSGKTTFSFPDGKTAERETTAGSVTWNQSEAHAAKIGDNDTHSLLVELKPPGVAKPKK